MVAWERSGANVQIKGATATGTSGEPHWHTALGAPLPTDRPTYAELRCSGEYVRVGVARPDLALAAVGCEQPGFWGVAGGDGALWHNDSYAEWDGQQRFGAGDVLGLLLEPEAGTLTVYKNSARLGQAVVPGMTLTNGKAVAGLGGGGLCWAASIGTTGSVELVPKDPIPALRALLRHGADRSLIDAQGRTALQLANPSSPEAALLAAPPEPGRNETPPAGTRSSSGENPCRCCCCSAAPSLLLGGSTPQPVLLRKGQRESSG